MSNLAMQLIAEAKRTNAKHLNLGNCGLTELPKELFELTQLEVLIISNNRGWEETRQWQKKKNLGGENRLYAIPQEIEALQALQILHLGGGTTYEDEQWHIDDITHLQSLTKLTYLNIDWNNLTSLAPLENLPNLERLSVMGSQLTNLNHLENLSKLQKLNISFNQLTSLENLTGFFKLQTLSLFGNQLKSFKNDEGFPNLQKLYIGKNQLTNLKELYGLPNLKVLDVQENRLPSLNSLNGFSNLQELCVDRNELTNLKGVCGFPNLQVLKARSNRILKLVIPVQLPHLQELDVSWNELISLEKLKRLPNVKKIDIHKNKLRRLENLDGLAHLQELNANFNQVSRLAFAIQLPNLKRLSMSYNKLRKLKNLDGFHNLEELSIAGNKLKKLENLDSLSNLKELDVRSNKLRKLENLNGLPNLQKLDVSVNKLKKLENLEKLSNLQELNISENHLKYIENLNGLPNLKTLDVSWNRLKKLENLDGLPKLQELKVNDNKLVKLTSSVNLPNLQELSIDYNKLKKLENLDKLPKLQKLNVDNNNVVKLASSIDLPSLQELNIRRNKLKKLENLDKLPNLQKLNVNNNKIVKLASSVDLPSLQELHISNNKLKKLENLAKLPLISELSIDYNKLLYFSPSNLKHYPKLENLCLKNNPIQNIPKEIYSNFNCLTPLKHYFKEVKKQASLNTELKLILIGNGRVGKSCLLDYWLDKPFDTQKASTHAIQLADWDIPKSNLYSYEGLKALSSLTFHVWDFGGQHLYHTTHRLFLRSRAIFVLLWDREQETKAYQQDTYGDAQFPNHPLSYWLHYVKILSPDSQVIIVCNKIDQYANRQETHPRHNDLAKQYPQIVAWINISVQESYNLTALTDHILKVSEQQIKDGPLLPTSWVTVRATIQQLAQKERDISYATFVDICQSNDLTTSGQIETVLYYLHDTGVLFYRKQLFQNRIILDQKWAIDVVYTVFDRQGLYYDLIQQGGFYERDLAHVWQQYNLMERRLLIGFMESCDICFCSNKYKYNFSVERKYIVPAFLPQNPNPKLVELWARETNKKYILHQYHFLHEGVIHSFIGRTREWAEQNRMWRTGILLIYKNTKVWVAADYINHQIRLEITHFSKPTYDANFIQKLHKIFMAIRADNSLRSIAYSVNGAAFVPAAAITQAQTMRVKNVRSSTGSLVPLADLSCFLSKRAKKNDLPKETLPPKRIFIAYAKEDQEAQNNLRRYLTPAQQGGLIQVWDWDQSQLGEGGEIEKETVKELEQADVVLCILSPDLLHSDFYEQHLVPLLNIVSPKKRLIPIFWKPCAWEHAPFASLMPIPIHKQWIAAERQPNELWNQIVKTVLEVVN